MYCCPSYARGRRRNTQLYRLDSAGASPLTLAEVKDYLDIPTTMTVDDAVLQQMIDSATEWGEKYTWRSFRVKTWRLLLDCFADRITIKRDPVTSITSVVHIVDDSNVTVPSTVYYLKNNVQNSEILLQENQQWPTNTDKREQAITITFQTGAYECLNSIKTALLRHVAYWYSNRGDCEDCECAAQLCGVVNIYNQFRIQRVC